jgi:hypothetical protein
MPGLTDYSAINILAYLTGKTNVPALPVVNVGLFTTAPTSDSGGGMIEVISSLGYSRVQVVGSSWNTPTGSVGSEPGVSPAQTSNASDILFTTAIGTWGTVLGFFITDSSVIGAGNNLYWDYLGNFNWLPATVNSASPAVITAPVHGYSNGDNVVITTKYGGTLPTFSQSNFTGVLTVANATANTFTVTNAAIAVNTSSSSDIQVRKISSINVILGNQIKIAAGSLIITSA